MKRDKYDDLFSKLVRARAGWKCERCESGPFPSGYARQGLHNAHLYGRGKGSTRLDFDNCFSLCYGCHRYFDGRKKTAFHPWAREKLGDERYEALVRRGNTTRRWKPEEKEQLYADMKAEWKTFVEQGLD